VSAAPSPFPWAEVMRFGLGVLRLPPDQFWKTTPREMARAIEAVTGRTGAPLARAEFSALMNRYPDGR